MEDQCGCMPCSMLPDDAAQALRELRPVKHNSLEQCACQLNIVLVPDRYIASSGETADSGEKRLDKTSPLHEEAHVQPSEGQGQAAGLLL